MSDTDRKATFADTHRRMLGPDEIAAFREDSHGEGRTKLIQVVGWLCDHADAANTTIAQLRAGNQLLRDFVSNHLGICLDCLGTGNADIYDGTAACGSCNGKGEHRP